MGLSGASASRKARSRDFASRTPLAQPPRDEQGHVLPHDDQDIRPDDGLLRYIDPRNHLIWDDNEHRWRITSGAYSASSEPNGSMSVDLERLLHEAGYSSLHRLPAENWGAVRFET